jgi:hypothetical protein
MSATAIVGIAWLLLSIPTAALFGRGLTVCDRRDRERRGLR